MYNLIFNYIIPNYMEVCYVTNKTILEATKSLLEKNIAIYSEESMKYNTSGNEDLKITVSIKV